MRLRFSLMLLAALICQSHLQAQEDDPSQIDFFKALNLAPLASQQDRFQIYESANNEGLLQNLSNNRTNDFNFNNTSPNGSVASLYSLGNGAIRDLGRINVKQESYLPATYVKSKLEVPDTLTTDRSVPYTSNNWKADELLKLTLPEFETVFIFGQFTGKGDYVRNTDADITGKTGVGVKFNPLPETELQFRTGRQLSITDLTSAVLDHSQFMMEVLAKMPLPVPMLDAFKLQLEYTGSALAAPTPADRSTIKQDLRIVFPVGKSNEFYLGAKYKYDFSNTPWIDRSEIYVGVTIKH